MRLGILHSSRTRILAYGGATAFEPSPLAGLGIDAGRSTGGDARARQVFAAFAAFRARHCDPGEAEGATREGDSREQYRDAAGKQAQEEGKQGARRQFWWEVSHFSRLNVLVGFYTAKPAEHDLSFFWPFVLVENA